jgi:hypothetical protein
MSPWAFEYNPKSVKHHFEHNGKEHRIFTHFAQICNEGTYEEEDWSITFLSMCFAETCNKGTHKANRYPHILISYVLPKLLVRKPRKMTRRKTFS